MGSLATASVMFGCVLASTVVAMLVARRLPEHHLGDTSRDVVKLGLGVIGTLTALVLGLLVSATKGTYDAQSGSVRDLAAEIALLDRVLARYGPEASEARARLRALTQAVLDQVWPEHTSAAIDFSGGPSRHAGEVLFDSIAALEPRLGFQHLLKTRAQKMLLELGQIREKLVVNNECSLPTPLLVMLGVWQAVLFAGFGLLAARNATTIAVLVVCMLSVSGAVFVVLELDRPFDGIVRISDTPLRSVLTHLGD